MILRFIAIFLLLATVSFAEPLKNDSGDGGAGIIYGSDHAFMLYAPQGWVLDNSSGVPLGLHAVFYPKGGSWHDSAAVMYANTASKKVVNNETIEKMMAFDRAQFIANNPGIAITDLPELKAMGDKRAIVKQFFYSNYDAVAYIDEATIVSILVLSARTEKDFKDAFPAFTELVRSYYFLTTDVHIEGK